MMNTKKLYLAGGCFWGMQDLFRKRSGVIETNVGYAGGTEERPTYESHDGHAEALEIIYDTDQTSLTELLDYFFRIHNPTTLNQQGNDRGTSYRSAIFYQNEDERQLAADFIDMVNNAGRWPDPVVTTLEPFSGFYLAEDFHQDYLEKNPGGYTCHVEHTGSYLD